MALIDVIKLVVIGIIILITYRLFTFALARYFRKQAIPTKLLNGVKVIIKSICIFIFVLVFFRYIQIPDDILISITSVGGLILGFASTEILAQLFSGIYIITSHLFSVDDLIEIDGNAGIVQEIGINYTILQHFDGSFSNIPNKSILEANIKNYTITLAEELEKRQSHLKDSQKIQKKDLELGTVNNEKLKSILGDLTDFLTDAQITRYTFLFSVDFSVPSVKVREALEKVCAKYTTVFGYAPHFSYRSLGWRLTVEIQLYCVDAHIIVDNYYSLMGEIATELYGVAEVGK
jgi:hypothetical protein